MTAEQEIRFCTASDGVRIAYASTGAGLGMLSYMSPEQAWFAAILWRDPAPAP